VRDQGTWPGRPLPGEGARSAAVGLKSVGLLGLALVVAAAAVLAAAAASVHGVYTPGRLERWPSWLESPLAGLHIGITVGRFQALTLLLAAGYGLALAGARALPGRLVAAAIVAAHVALLLGPPLLSRDVVGYLSFARLGALHGLDPYAHVMAQAPRDPLYPFVSWPHQHTPYGPLFTLASYALAPLGLAAGIWTLKALAALASLGAVALIARAASAERERARTAAVFVGLNPALLELAVGGDHNDTLLLLLSALALALMAPARPGRRAPRLAHVRRAGPRAHAAAAALVAAVGIKISAGVPLPFLLASRERGLGRRTRTEMFAVALGGLALLAGLAFAAFGVHGLGFLGAVHEEQRMVAPHSIPAETARLLGLHGVPVWLRYCFGGAAAAACAAALLLTARGMDWRTGAGWALIAVFLGTAWLLPWYAVWPLPFAALSRSRALRVAALGACAYALLFHLPLAAPLLGHNT
jgi:alpha-1,6-mannosyltransferase